ncbi:MAG: hypothetical protein GC187_01650 [Alphaproteobacteria bacterium]|nr:hypothetical protein [Alphaproteobacteria bacterium]
MTRALDQSEHSRRALDRGRAARAWNWFSRRTIEAGSHYRDLSWRTVWVQALMASGLVLASRIDPAFALSPWALLAGVVWALLIARIAILKAT